MMLRGLGFVLALSVVAAANANLIVNGDFEAGNTGFTSQYTYSPANMYPQGVYTVDDNPNDVHTSWATMTDHTTGAGNVNMLIVNGDAVPTTQVWTQTVSGLATNTVYYFSAWVASVFPESPAQLQFSADNVMLGPVFVAPGTTGVWQQFYATFNSGANTSATFSIVNQNTAFSGNDFAIDDIVVSTEGVPEPATMATLACGALALLRRRRQK